MAQIGEQKKSGPTASASRNVTATSAGGEQKSFFSRLVPSLTGRGGSGPQTGRPARQQSPMGKMLFGWMIMLLVIEVVSIALQFLDIKVFNGALENSWFHSNAFLIGGMNTYYLLTLAAIIGTYFLLVRFKIMPRDFFGPRPQAATPANQPGKPAPDGLGKSRHSRAARRYTSPQAATASQASSTRRTASKTRAVVAPPPPAVPTGHDNEYYRVKEAQRQQRRREAKR